MLNRTHRSWRGWLRVPAAKRLYPLIIVAALCLPGASVAISAADRARPEPPSLGAFYGVSDGVTTCSVEADGARLVSAPAPPDSHATGFIAPPMDLSYLMVESLPGRLSASAYMTETFDWRDWGGVNYVTPVLDQSTCGACYAFAALGNIESKALIDGVTPPPDYSENHAKDCTWFSANVPGAGGCTGGNYPMLANLYSKAGTVNETDDPYMLTDGACQSPTGPYQTTLLGWQLLSGPTAPPTMTVKQALVDNGPLYSAFYTGDVRAPAWDATFDSYDGSTVLNYTGDVTDTNHAVLIVGWDDTAVHSSGQGAWIVKNSWGTAWGDNGYFMIAYDSAGLGTYAAYMTDWQAYDANGGIWYYDEGGWTGYTGYGTTTAWGLNVFTATQQTNVTRVEFWAPDTMPDVDIALYDTFDGSAPSGLLWQSNDHTYPTAGYYSVPVTAPLQVAPGDTVVAVVQFTAQNMTKPIPTDHYGPVSGNSYTSLNGGIFVPSIYDIGIRLRTSTMPADLELTKEVLGADFGPGDQITFTLTIENAGTGPANSPVLTDTMPSEVVNTAFTSTVLITQTGTQDYVWQVAPLGVGETGIITITGELAGWTAEGEAFENEATVHDPEDGRLTNNTSSVQIGQRYVFLPLVLRGYPPLQERTFYSTGDTVVFVGRPTTPMGSSDYLHAGYGLDGCPSEVDDVKVARTLVQFDLSTLPASYVQRATLNVKEQGYCGWENASNPTITSYQVSSPWSETTVTWNTAPSPAEAYGAATVAHSDGSWDWYEIDVTDLANRWLQGTPNYGLMLRGYEASDANSIIVSFWAQGTGYGPYLVVEYYGEE
jgi:uncharacterized repeat protein (TIGR01451 family)